MSRIRFYLDENVQGALAEAMRSRGIDVLTTLEAGNIGASDLQQLDFVRESQRAIVSYNVGDFAALHHSEMKKGNSHFGIILSDIFPVGMILRRLMKIYFSVPAEEIKDRLEYLGNWR